MTKTRFNNWQKLAMLAIPLAIMLNPMTVQIYMDFILLVFTVISMMAAGYLCAFILYKVLKPEAVNIPKKGAKTQRAGKLIET